MQPSERTQRMASFAVIILFVVACIIVNAIDFAETNAKNENGTQPPEPITQEEQAKTAEDEAEDEQELPEYIVFDCTAYCPCEQCCGAGASGITASGTQATEGRTVAADPSILPYGTEIYIQGLGNYVVEDCGGAINGYSLDLFFATHQAAVEFGRKQLSVEIRG